MVAEWSGSLCLLSLSCTADILFISGSAQKNTGKQQISWFVVCRCRHVKKWIYHCDIEKQRMMNFHNGGGNGRGTESLREGAGHNKDSKQLYESVFAKHYQIIQTFLEKINELYNKHDEFEHSINSLEDKIEKLEISSKNIHYEFRTTHLMLDKKINSINSDYNSLQEQVKIIQMDMPIDSYLSSTHFLAKTSQLRSRNKNNRNKQRKNKQSYKIEVHSNQDLNATTPGLQTPQQSLKNSSKKLQIGSKMVALSPAVNNSEIPEKSVSFDCFSSNSSQHEIRKSSQHEADSPCNVSMAVNNESLEEDEVSIQQEHCCLVNEEMIRTEVQKQFQSVNQRLNEQIQKLSEMNVRLKNDLSLQMESEQQKWKNYLKCFEREIVEGIDKRLEKIKIGLQGQINHSKEDILAFHKHNIQQVDQKIAQKVDCQFFEASLNNLSHALSQEFTKHEKIYSNKVQTKRALDFLEKKINRLIAEDASLRSKKQFTGMDDPCLKINKCQSNKRLDCLSEKSIKEKFEDINYNSLETSMRDIEGIADSQTSNKDDNRFKRVISNIISWKNPVLKSAIHHDDNKFLRSTTKVKEVIRDHSTPLLSKTLSVHHPQHLLHTPTETPTNEKQWKEKVVKVLKKDGVRKRKVTFR